MSNTSIYKNKTKTGNRTRSCHFFAVLLVCSALLITGCTHVTPQQQRLVSKPNMQFYRSTMFSYESRLLSQVETSLASAAGSPSSGGACSSCTPGD